MFSELEEHPGRFAEVSESHVEKFIEGEETANNEKRKRLMREGVTHFSHGMRTGRWISMVDLCDT